MLLLNPKPLYGSLSLPLSSGTPAGCSGVKVSRPELLLADHLREPEPRSLHLRHVSPGGNAQLTKDALSLSALYFPRPR